MILNRPTNLWIAAFATVFNVAVLVLGQNGVVLGEALVAAVNLAFVALVLLIAGQPPQVNTGGTVVVRTNNGHTDKRITFHESGDAVTTPIEGTDHPKDPEG